MDQKELSIVSPVYVAENIVEELVSQIIQSVADITDNFEIILIDDGSSDKSWEKIVKCCEEDSRVKGIKLSRNFGQHKAIFTGLTHSKGEWVVVMDCDLQDQPGAIPEIYNKAIEGYDIVFASRENRIDNYFKKVFSKWFYKVLGYLTNTIQDHKIANFGIYHRKVITALLGMNDYVKYFPAMVKWVGFKSTSVDVVHSSRHLGRSSYDFNKRINLAIDIILSFSDKPLRLTVKLGLVISVLSFSTVCYFLYKFIAGEIVVLGFTSLIISIWFLSGILITIVGMLGLYIGKVFDQTKERPVFIIDEMINL